jgi:hypothetical protein
MRRQQYRVREPLRGVQGNGEKGILVIPAGATLSFISQEDGAWALVDWDGQQVHIFSEDLSGRAVPVSRLTDGAPRS